ncbi:MAG: ribosome maturation factor RimM [Candidatus Puniceispirillaceae bacterium]|jgi:16S rRNA processing protein RimM
MSSGRLAIGAVAGAHGVRGQFKVKPFTTAPRDITTYGPVWAGDRQLTLCIMGMTAAGMVIVKAAEISDRESAAALRGTALEVDRKVLPDVGGDEIYHADLLGLAVETIDGDSLGTLVALHDFGAGEIAEVKPPKGPTLMLPFAPAYVPDIDLAAGRIVMAPPEGLLELADDEAPMNRDARDRSDSDG